jgi:hypothetical protein
MVAPSFNFRVLKTRFFVFDVLFDAADVRIYSEDKDLSRFNEFVKRMRLGVHGDHFGAGEPKFIGEVDIPSETAAKQMGVDFSQLQCEGIFVVILREASRDERLRRYLERELSNSDELHGFAKSMGMRLKSIRVDQIKFVEPKPSRSHSEPNVDEANNHRKIENGSSMQIKDSTALAGC